MIVSMVIALFLEMRTLHEMNRALQKSFEDLHYGNNENTEQTNLSHFYDFV